MHPFSALFFAIILAFALCAVPNPARAQTTQTAILPRAALAAQYYDADAPWFAANIPFFDCSDAALKDVYYYRWKLYKSHLKDLGPQGYIVTEFLDDVSWAWRPFQSLNDATAFHIYEGRWLKDRRYVNDYIDFMYAGGGNNRHFSEAIADAVYAHYMADGDLAFATKNLAAMQAIYHAWDDHYDTARGLYFIEPISDATEYTISSVDASGGKDGFRGGVAFRPTINSFMYANAQAISKLAALQGDTGTAQTFAAKADALRLSLETNLWNASFGHFTDRYKVNNSFVHNWDFIRGRELAGFAPWAFHLPDTDPKYAQAWTHLLSPAELGGPFGLRTVEPTYEYYMKQYRYDTPTGLRECQWNGPTWPFQTTMALGGMANLLNDYTQNVVTKSDYTRLLKQYAHLHYLNGQLDLQEDYDPDTGKVIVGLPRSHHYNHSGYTDLIITGLVGLRPRADNTLEINPLVPTDPHAPDFIRYFCLENVPYHGHNITIVFDADGKHYKKGAGLSVYADGRRVLAPSPLGRRRIAIPAPVVSAPARPINLAVRLARTGYPTPSASVNVTTAALAPAVDGRVWFYANVPNYWTNTGSQTPQDWYGVDFGQEQTISAVQLYFCSDGVKYKAPAAYQVQYWTGTDWAGVPGARPTPAAPLANGENTVHFPPLKTTKLRALFTNPTGAAIALTEIKAFP